MWNCRVRDRKRKTESLPVDKDGIKENIKKKTAQLKAHKQSELDRISKCVAELREQQRPPRNHTEIHAQKDIEAQIAALTQKRLHLVRDKHLEEFAESVGPLTDASQDTTPVMAQQRQLLYMNVFQKTKMVPSFIEHDVCAACKCDLVVISQESVVRCPGCGVSESEVFCTSDFLDTPETKTNTYDRGPLYRKYLNQFREETPLPPEHVIEVVYRNLARVHMMLSTKVKPTPIAQILRNEKLQKWVPYSVRIARFINNEPTVILPNDLISRLVTRFEKLTHAFTHSKQKRGKKIMNFEFLTKQFLLMEQEHALARSFACHKTRTVLKQADMRLMRCSQKLREEDSASWPVARSC